jgi:hypothetical protein
MDNGSSTVKGLEMGGGILAIDMIELLVKK